jgi:hypothetical protein
LAISDVTRLRRSACLCAESRLRCRYFMEDMLLVGS